MLQELKGMCVSAFLVGLGLGKSADCKNRKDNLRSNTVVCCPGKLNSISVSAREFLGNARQITSTKFYTGGH